MTRRCCLFSLCALGVLMFIGCSDLPGKPHPGPEVPRPDSVLEFSTLYQQNCSGCHGAEGRGGAAIALANPVYLAIADDATLRQVTAAGMKGTSMPGFAQSAGGMLTDQQIDALVQGMRTNWGKKGSLGGVELPPYSAPAGDAQRGADSYKTYCAGCHGTEKGSSKAGSIIDGSYLGLVSDQALRTIVITGRPELGGPDWRSNVPRRPMSSQEIADIVAWLSAQRPQYPGQPYPSPPPATGGNP